MLKRAGLWTTMLLSVVRWTWAGGESSVLTCHDPSAALSGVHVCGAARGPLEDARAGWWSRPLWPAAFSCSDAAGISLSVAFGWR